MEYDISDEEIIQAFTDINKKQIDSNNDNNANGDYVYKYLAINNGREYILPGSDYRYISESELYGLSEDEVRLAVNEIYARHGRKFVKSELQSYFNSKSWYHPYYEPSDFDESCFNIYEKENISMITAYERQGCPYKDYYSYSTRPNRSVYYINYGGDVTEYVYLDYSDSGPCYFTFYENGVGTVASNGADGIEYSSYTDYTGEVTTIESGYWIHYFFVENGDMSGYLYDIDTGEQVGCFQVKYEYDSDFGRYCFTLYIDSNYINGFINESAYPSGL